MKDEHKSKETDHKQEASFRSKNGEGTEDKDKENAVFGVGISTPRTHKPLASVLQAFAA